MNSDEIWDAVDTERASLAVLVESLADADWDRPSLCDEWRVRDVVAHLILSTESNLGWILANLANLVRARGNIDRLIRDTAIRRGERPHDRLAADLRATVGSRFTPIGTTPTDRLMDLLVHGQDIAVPLGLRREMPVLAARVAIEHVWGTKTFHARKRLAGYRLVATDVEWTAGHGATVEGPISALLLLSTGRIAALADLRGDGAFELKQG